MSTLLVLGPMVAMIEDYLLASLQTSEGVKATFLRYFCSGVKSLKPVASWVFQASWERGCPEGAN